MAKQKELPNASSDKVSLRLWLSLLGVLTVLVLVCYANTLSFTTVFNDPLTLSLAHIQEKHSGNLLLEMFIRPMMQPWTRQSFLTDEANYGRVFGWYHLVNVYLHWTGCAALFLLVFRVARRWCEDKQLTPYVLSFAAAALFACHPIGTETATYISARAASLGTANYLLCLNLFLFALNARAGAPKFWLYLLTVAFGWMCLTSSLIGISLPLGLLAVLLMTAPEDLSWKDRLIDHSIVSGILLALVIACPLSLALGFAPAAVPNWYGMAPTSAIAYYATQAKALIVYNFRTFLLPFGLSIDPPFTHASSFADVLAILGVLVFAGLSAGVYWLRKNKLAQFGVVLFLLLFLPHALLPQSELVSDPSFYPALTGLCILGACVADRLCKGDWRIRVMKFAPVIFVLTLLSILHNFDFANNKALIASTFKINAASAVGHTLAGIDAMQDRRLADAAREADLALMSEPDSDMALLVKGTSLSKLNRPKEAQEPLARAAEFAVKRHLGILPMAKYAIAENLVLLNDPDAAQKWAFEAAVDEPNPRAFYLFGMVSFVKKDYEKAYVQLAQASKLGIDDAWAPLAKVSLRLGRYLDAVKYAQYCIDQHPSMDNTFTLAAAFIGNHDLASADSTLSKVLKENPHNAGALALLSVVYERKGEAGVSKSYRDEALSADPNIFSKLVIPGK